jgi:uncharacterized protein involved in outer membrane biogenesis
MANANARADGVTRFFAGPVSAWWDWRRKRFWVIVLLALYTLAGFFVAPWLVRRELISQMQAHLDLPVQLEELHINPWAMTAEATGFSVNEPDGTRILGFDRLFVNVQLSSLFRWALTFREIALDHPYAQVTRYQTGALNVDPILLKAAADPGEASAEKPSGPLRLLIHDLTITDGRIEARDDSHATPFTASIGPINIDVQDLTTLPDQAGQHQIAVSTARGTRLEWSGSFELDPILSSGRVTGSGPYVPLLYQYFQDELNFELTEGHVDLEFDYQIAVNPDTGLEAEITNAHTVLRNAAMTMENDVAGITRFVSLPEIRLEAGRMTWPERSMTIDALVVSDPEVQLWLDEDGVLSVERLFPESSEPVQASDEPQEAAPTWDVHLGEFRIDNLTAEFTDHGLENDGTVIISDLDFSLRNITNQPGDTFPIGLTLVLQDGGEIRLDGKIQALPDTTLDADFEVAGLALDIVQPWLTNATRMEIDAGTLDVTAKLSITPEETMSFIGGMKVLGLDISDTTLNERLVGWDSLNIDRMVLSVSENRLEISQLTLDTPYSRLRIAEDQSTNYQELVISDAPSDGGTSSDTKPATASGTVALTVGQVVINNGSADFSDLSLPLPFSIRISELNGRISALATVSEEPAKIDLTGQVGEYGLVEISGQIKPLDPTGLTDINILFRNVGMPDLSPYTIKFAGREIDEGRMELDLRYIVDGGQLHGENGIVIDKLELGDKVEHPDAVDLPLGLAVALLKGPDGKIDIDMPVRGNVDDPEFSIGGVIFKAFVNLITKMVTSPFNLLGKLVGVESEDFDVIEFRPGVAELTPPEREKLVKLSEALDLRPNLGLTLRGVADPVADAEALKASRVDAEIEARLKEQADETENAAMLTEQRHKITEALALEMLPVVDFTALKAEHQRPKDADKPDGRQVLDEPAYTAALQELLIEAEDITEEDLDDLATARANAVRDEVTADSRVDANRVTVTAMLVTEIGADGWVPMQLELSSGSGRRRSEPSASN